jgi:hypothetical protein
MEAVSEEIESSPGVLPEEDTMSKPLARSQEVGPPQTWSLILNFTASRIVRDNVCCQSYQSVVIATPKKMEAIAHTENLLY